MAKGAAVSEKSGKVPRLRKSELEKLYSLSNAILNPRGPKFSLTQMTGKVMEIFGTDGVALYDRRTARIVRRGSRAKAISALALYQAVTSGLRIADADGSLYLAPIPDGGETVGTIGNTGAWFSEQLLSSIALRLGMGLARLHAIEEEDLQKSRESLATFVRNLPARVAMLDRDMRYVQASGQWCADYQLDCSQLLGRTHYEIFPEIPERWKELHRRGLAGETLRAEEDFFDRADGRRTWLRWQIRPWGNREGRPEGILLFSEDITDRKEAEFAERKRMQDRLHEREGELDALLKNVPDVVVRFDRDLRYTYVNARVEKETGLQQEEMVGKRPSELRMPEPVVKIVTHALRAVFETARQQVAQLSYPTPGGVTHWEARFFPEFGANGAVQSVLNIARDITEEKRLAEVAQTYATEVQTLAAGLLTTQEEERRKVSRELHDQICQQLASLAMDIGRLAAGPLPPENLQVELRALQARVVQASAETRHIAYALHPSIIDDLGVVASLSDLSRQFSERNPDIALGFTSGPIPAALPREVVSCLYRVAQECLQNIAKHSGAKHASMALGFEKGSIILTIVDDGAGFDLKTFRGRGGLGMIGMEERARFVNGKLVITARAERGARIVLTVPLSDSNL